MKTPSGMCFFVVKNHFLYINSQVECFISYVKFIVYPLHYVRPWVHCSIVPHILALHTCYFLTFGKYQRCVKNIYKNREWSDPQSRQWTETKLSCNKTELVPVIPLQWVLLSLMNNLYWSMHTVSDNAVVYQLIFRHQSCTAVSLTAHASIGRSSVVTMATVSSTISSISDTNTLVCGAFCQDTDSYNILLIWVLCKVIATFFIQTLNSLF